VERAGRREAVSPERDGRSELLERGGRSEPLRGGRSPEERSAEARGLRSESERAGRSEVPRAAAPSLPSRAGGRSRVARSPDDERGLRAGASATAAAGAAAVSASALRRGRRVGAALISDSQ